MQRPLGVIHQDAEQPLPQLLRIVLQTRRLRIEAELHDLRPTLSSLSQQIQEVLHDAALLVKVFACHGFQVPADLLGTKSAAPWIRLEGGQHADDPAALLTGTAGNHPPTVYVGGVAGHLKTLQLRIALDQHLFDKKLREGP